MPLRYFDAIHVDTILVPSLLLGNLDVVSTHLALPHQAIFGKRPVLESVGAPPLARLIVPLVPKLHGDLVVGEGEQLLAQAISLLLVPLLGEEFPNGIATDEKLVAVAPDRVGRVRHLDDIRIPFGP